MFELLGIIVGSLLWWPGSRVLGPWSQIPREQSLGGNQCAARHWGSGGGEEETLDWESLTWLVLSKIIYIYIIHTYIIIYIYTYTHTIFGQIILTLLWTHWNHGECIGESSQYSPISGQRELLWFVQIWGFPKVVFFPPNYHFYLGIVHYKPSSYGSTTIDGTPF